MLLTNNTVGWGQGIMLGRGGAGWVEHTGGGVGTTGPGGVEVGESG